MGALRLMTFNVQLMHPVAPAGNEAVERAGRVVRALTGLPADERPDLVAFNEAFHEAARGVLVDGLRGEWPHVVEKLEDGLCAEDSGLMLFSRLPFLELPASLQPLDGRVAFRSFSDAAGIDAVACKGVGLVQVEWFGQVVTVAFAHLQAFYEREDEHRDVREKQLQTIAGLIDDALGPDLGGWASVVIMGDLNIRGDPGAQAGEWASVFAQGPGRFASHLADGWREYLRPPGRPFPLDPGYTNSNLSAGDELPVGLLTRLDYQLFGRGPDRQLVPQQMVLRFRTLSDHVSLESHAHRRTPHCTPADALVAASTPALGWQALTAQITFPGSYQWIYVPEAATYSLFPDPHVELEVFAADDLSGPLPPLDETEVAHMGIDGLEAAWKDVGHGLEPRGTVHAPRGPFFIRLRARRDDPDWTGTFRTGLYRHQGASPATAIFLHPHAEPVDPHLPPGQRLGAEDVCWFRAHLGSALSGKPHTATFFLENSTGRGAELQLLDDQGTFLDGVSGDGSPLELSRTEPGPRVLFLRLRREDLSQIAFRAGWRQGLTFLRDDRSQRPLVVRCLDETGIDVLGADEVRLKLYADDMAVPFFEDAWDDVDTDEARALAGVPEIAFVDQIRVEVNEEEALLAGDPGAGRLPALTELDPLVEGRFADVEVQTGLYRFEYTLSRFPA